MSSLLSAILAAATLATFPLGSAPSYPEEVEVHTVRGEHVTLITATVPEAKTNIIPGQTARWGVGVHVNAPSAGTISAGLSVSGDFPLEASVYSCPAPWTTPPTGEGSIEEECPADLEAMTVFRPVHPGHETDWVGSFSSEEEERWLRVEARMPLDSPHETQNSTSRLRFHISGDGHEISTELPGESSPSDAPGAASEADPLEGSERPDDSAAGSPDAGAGPGETRAQAPGRLAQTGFSLLALVGAGLLSVLLGRALHRSSQEVRDDA